jgi:hypothetical protein
VARVACTGEGEKMLRDGRVRGLRDTIREVEAGGSADMTGERGGGDDGCIVGGKGEVGEGGGGKAI